METLEQKARRLAATLAANGLVTNPPLTHSALSQLERRHGLYLPDDYRAFLLHIGDGADGPYHGVPRLSDAIDASQPDSLRICDMPAPHQGRLLLTGPGRGRVVYLTPGHPPHPVRDPGFLSWYERWLDDFLSDSLSPRFGFDDAEPAAVEPPPPVAIPPGPWRERLERLRAVVTTGHSAWRPPLAPAAIAELEARHGVALPPEYRAFIEFVQAGGDGPFYGLVPVEYAFPADGLAAPFPHTPGETPPRGLRRKAGALRPPGTLTVSHLGLSRYAFLVVTGPAAGRIVYLDLDLPNCHPVFAPAANFLDWYESWLTAGDPPPIRWKSR